VGPTSSAALATGTGTLTIGAVGTNITAVVQSGVAAASPAATVSGNLNINAPTGANGGRFFVINESLAPVELSVSAAVSNGDVNKLGQGTLAFSGNNSYTGATLVNAGTLVASSNNALGTSANGTTVARRAMLVVQGGISTNEPLILNGTGVGGAGALV